MQGIFQGNGSLMLFAYLLLLAPLMGHHLVREGFPPGERESELFGNIGRVGDGFTGLGHIVSMGAL